MAGEAIQETFPWATKWLDESRGLRTQEIMQDKRYSTGTKGRLHKHADDCRNTIHRHAPDFALATEFIQSLDPSGDHAFWQKFRLPSDVVPHLEAWLGGEEAPAGDSQFGPLVRKASELIKEPGVKES